MKITNKLAFGAVVACFSLASLGHDADAQPSKRQERREARKERRQERREEVKEKRKDLKEKREDLKEKRKDLKEKRKELRDQFREKRARHKELKKKEEAGELSDEEKEELAKLKEGREKRKQRHEELKARHKELKKTWKKRRIDARRKLHEKYPNMHKHPAAVAEFRKHARRMARLHRAKEIATADERTEMAAKIDELIAAEQARHNAWVAKHKARWEVKKAKGGSK